MASEDDRLDWLRLVLTPGLGPSTRHNLLEAFETPAGVFAQSEETLLRVPSIEPKQVRAIRRTADGEREREAEKERLFLEAKGVRIVARSDPDFPPRLLRIDPSPTLLFVRGTLEEGDIDSVAVVGTRRCDSYGLRMTREIVTELSAHGLSIVSGLANGIDGAAHRAALARGGRTWAFLPCGFETLYPPDHIELAEEIVQNGALLSEFTMSVKPIPRCFPTRNRLVSGCALGVLIVQAPKKSGALITAARAMEQNREVFAVPGRVDEPGSEGPHALIQDGAKLVRNADDILCEIAPLLSKPLESHRRTSKAGGRSSSPPVEEEVGQARRTARGGLGTAVPPSDSVSGKSPEPTRKPETYADPLDGRIVERLEEGPTHIDRICERLGVPVRKVSERLLILEMSGIVRRLPGMTFDLSR